jgi:hypothetical protein
MTGTPRLAAASFLVLIIKPRFPYVFGGTQGIAGMAYVVRAVHVDGVTGTFTAEKNTRREAVELAKSLRDQGLWVIIIGPDGKTIEDETKDE